jgi:hypothetical protein
MALSTPSAAASVRTGLARAARRALVITAGAAAALAVPAAASAQFASQERPTIAALGERYHVELSGTFWNPSLFGLISSEQFDIIGSEVDFVGDLGFQQTRFKDFRIVLRPSKKSRFRIQYTPVVYTAETQLKRTIVFGGQTYSANLPINSTFGWKVWRFGYEYDFFYTDRGFVGALIEARATDFQAHLTSPLNDEFTTARAPFPAVGVVARAYVLPELAVNFEVSGFKLPDIDPKYQANYFDWDIHGTFNFTNNVGVQVGWRRMTTFLAIENDTGDLKFQGMWFGAAVRY